LHLYASVAFTAVKMCKAVASVVISKEQAERLRRTTRRRKTCRTCPPWRRCSRARAVR